MQQEIPQKYLKKGDNAEIIFNTDYKITLPKWFCRLIPFINGLLELKDSNNPLELKDSNGLLEISLDENLVKFIPELLLWFKEVLVTRKFSEKYTPVHFETITIINFLGFEKPLNIRLFNILKINDELIIPATICTLDEYLKLLPRGFHSETKKINREYDVYITGKEYYTKFAKNFHLKSGRNGIYRADILIYNFIVHVSVKPLRIIKAAISDVYISRQLYELCITDQTTWRYELQMRK